MYRFFVDDIDGETVKISKTEAHHLKNVLRKKVGDVVFLFDGKGNEYKAAIRRLEDLEIELSIISKIQKDTEPRIKINLYQSIPKWQKFDFIVEKTTELGVSKIVPVISERAQITQIKDADYADKKLIRWQKIVVSAAKQCGRNIVPEVSPIQTFNDAVLSISQSQIQSLSLIPWECEQTTTLKKVLQSNSLISNFVFLNLFIGPEGGFSLAEIELAKASGIIPVSLGKRILRTETAPIVVVANILYELDSIH